MGPSGVYPELELCVVVVFETVLIVIVTQVLLIRDSPRLQGEGQRNLIRSRCKSKDQNHGSDDKIPRHDLRSMSNASTVDI